MTFSEIIEKLTPGQATLISSIISALIALTVFWTTKYFDNKKGRQEKYDAVKKYANPIIFASEQLAWRLKEILSFNGAYLLANAPQNGFFKYKFESTVYRLCAVLGWIQAAKKEQSYIDGIKIKQHKKVQSAIAEFHKKLADGSHVEVSILNDLAKLFNLNLGTMTDNDRSLLGVELEKIVFKYIPDSVKKSVTTIEESRQVQMLQEILDYTCSDRKQSKIKAEIVVANRVVAINEICREYCWIYRDWQSAIGDEMIEKIQGANRRFDVIGFAEFQTKHDQNEWLKKVDNLFSDLNVSVDDRFDSRVKQLKELFQVLVELIESLQILVKKQETISQTSLDGLREFNKKINPVTEKKRKRLRIKFSYQ
jgi:hypothetical protein